MQAEITAPDGTKMQITAPDGTPPEQILAYAKAHYQPTDKSTAEADKLFPKREPSTIERVLNAPNDIATGVARGLAKGIGGMVQLAADAIGPKTGDAVTQGVQGVDKWLKTGGEMLNAAPTLAGPWRAQGRVAASPSLSEIGEFVGQVLPFVAAPETSIIRGASVPARLADAAVRGGAAGAATFQEGKGADERWEDRGLGAAGGALLGAGTGTLGAIGVKALNAADIRKGMQTIVDWAGDTDPALTNVRADIAKPLAKAQRTFEEKSVDLARHQDLLGPIPLKDTEGTLEVISNKVASLKDISDTSLQGTLRRTLAKIAPQFVEPEEIPISKGGKAIRTGPGQYTIEGSDKPLSSSAVKVMLDAYKKKNPLAATYTQIKSAIETLDEKLGKSKTGEDSPLRATALELRDALQAKLDAHATPAIKRQTTALERWKKANLDPLRDPDLKPVLAARDGTAQANAVLSLALAPDKQAVAATAAKLVGAKGQEAVLRGAVKKAMDSALDVKTGQYDPVKFATFFDKKPGLTPFMDKNTGSVIRGMKNLMTEASLRAGEASRTQLPNLKHHPFFAGSLAFGVASRLAEGHVKEGVLELAGIAGTQVLFRGIEKVMNDSFGRTLLAAAASVKPGSPRSARILQTLVTKFGVPAGGVASGNASSP